MSLQEQVAKMEQELAAMKARVNTPMAAPVAVQPQDWQSLVTTAVKAALTQQDLAFLAKHVSEGANGLIPFIKGPRFEAMVQLLRDEYYEHLKEGK